MCDNVGFFDYLQLRTCSGDNDDYETISVSSCDDNLDYDTISISSTETNEDIVIVVHDSSSEDDDDANESEACLNDPVTAGLASLLASSRPYWGFDESDYESDRDGFYWEPPVWPPVWYVPQFEEEADVMPSFDDNDNVFYSTISKLWWW